MRHSQQRGKGLSTSSWYKYDSTPGFGYTGLGKRVGPMLRELAPRGQRELGGGIHAT